MTPCVRGNISELFSFLSRITVGGSKFMWRQPSPYPETAKLCSAEGPTRTFWLIEGRSVRYAQKQGKRVLFGNVTTPGRMTLCPQDNQAVKEGVNVKARAERGRGGGRRPQNCVCLNCGERTPHQPGQPCFEQKCPKCGGQMRGE
jgi:hypothetical protein